MVFLLGLRVARRPAARVATQRATAGGRYRHASATASLIDCSKVVAAKDHYGGAGAFARVQIKKGELVERGVVRRLPVDGSVCPYVFTWSEDKSIWASGSGCSVFYNASVDGSENTEMKRFFDEDSFEIVAIRDIARGEELTHLYKSIEWRECFRDLKKLRDSHASNPAKPLTGPPQLKADSEVLIDCSKVYAKRDAFGGVGAYAAVPIKKGELVERGIVRRLPVDGNVCPYVFTWSDDRSVWASGSGCSVFYNASLDGSENTEMKRFFDEDRFEIFATQDIAQDEELTHLYKSIEWRDCFKDLKALLATHHTDRASFKEYWGKDHSAPTLENMMLDSDAGSMDALERPEILSKLPSLQGKRVLELGAGIGRFSGTLAEKADKVVAVDFVEASCLENRRANADKPNLEVLTADVTMLQFEPNSFDLIFSNWLLMYLSQEALIGRYFSVKTQDLASEFVGFMDEGLQRIEDTFGEGSPARDLSLGRVELDALHQPLQDTVNRVVPRLPAAAADEVVEAALEKLSLHVTAAEADVERCKGDYNSLKEIWELERKASVDGELKWCFFVATKDEPSL